MFGHTNTVLRTEQPMECDEVRSLFPAMSRHEELTLWSEFVHDTMWPLSPGEEKAELGNVKTWMSLELLRFLMHCTAFMHH